MSGGKAEGALGVPRSYMARVGSWAASGIVTYVLMQLLVQRGFVVVTALHLQPRHQGFDGEALEWQEKARERLGGREGAWLEHGEQKQQEVTGTMAVPATHAPTNPTPVPWWTPQSSFPWTHIHPPLASLPRVLNARARAHQQLCKENSLDRHTLLELLEPVPAQKASGKRAWAMAPPLQQSPQ